jgi:hypothetical protein
MSLMDKIKSLFGGGSSDTADAHAGHDHAGSDLSAHDQVPEPTPVAPPVAQTGSAGIPTSEPQPAEEQDDRLE